MTIMPQIVGWLIVTDGRPGAKECFLSHGKVTNGDLDVHLHPARIFGPAWWLKAVDTPKDDGQPVRGHYRSSTVLLDDLPAECHPVELWA
jgi:hypothetical protein